MSRGVIKTIIRPVPGKWVPAPGTRVRSSLDGQLGTVTQIFNQFDQDFAEVAFGTDRARRVYLSQIEPVDGEVAQDAVRKDSVTILGHPLRMVWSSLVSIIVTSFQAGSYVVVETARFARRRTS